MRFELDPGNPRLRLRNWGLVAAGYAVAILVASVAEYVRIRNTMGPEAQASSGMYAFGDAVLWAGVFSLVALFPSALALRLLRDSGRFWTVFSVLCLAVAATGVATVAIMLLPPLLGLRQPFWATTQMFGVLRLLVAPLFAAAFAVATVLAPARRPRMLLLAATVAEFAASIYVMYGLLVRHRLG